MSEPRCDVCGGLMRHHFGYCTPAPADKGTPAGEAQDRAWEYVREQEVNFLSWIKKLPAEKLNEIYAITALAYTHGFDDAQARANELIAAMEHGLKFYVHAAPYGWTQAEFRAHAEHALKLLKAYREESK